MALPKSHRLSLRFERDRLTQTGKALYGHFFTLIVAESKDNKKKNPQVAILLSKKTAPLAVHRNKIKRITSSLLESLIYTIPQRDYLVIPKKQVLTEEYKTLMTDIKSIFEKS